METHLTPEQNAQLNKLVEESTKALVDKGMMIEASFIGFMISAYGGADKVPKDKLTQIRDAFFAGAQGVFSGIITFMEEGSEPTETDMKRVDSLANELSAFVDDFKKRRLT